MKKPLKNRFGDFFKCRFGLLPVMLLLLLFSIPLHLYSQKQGQAYVDSLLTALPKIKNDTSRIAILSKVSYVLKDINPDVGLKYGEQALALSQKINWKKGIADSENSLGVNHSRKSDYDLARDYFKKALQIFGETRDKKGIASITASIGWIYFFEGNVKMTLQFQQEALKISNEIGDKHGIAETTCNLGYVYLAKSDFTKALDYSLKAFNKFKEIRDKNGMAEALNCNGNIYYTQGNSAKALDCYLKALKINREIGNKLSISNNTSNIGALYGGLGNFDKALQYFFESQKVAEELGDKTSCALGFNNIADAYLSKKDYPQAIAYCLKSIKLYNSIGSDGEFLVKSTLGKTYLGIARDKASGANKKRWTQKAIAYLKETSHYYLVGNHLNEFQDDAKLLSEAYEFNGDYSKALATFKEHAEYKDSIFNKEKTQEFTRKELDFEYAKKQDSLKLVQQRKDAIAGFELKRQKNMRNAWIGGAILLLLVALGAGFAYRLKRRDNLVISKEKERSEKLLLNILSEEIAEELKNNGRSEARQYNEVSVLFTDFVNFTQISELLTPKELVKELHECFTAFDGIMERNGLEKIKTIGDAYMAVCGLPLENREHAK
ncbi:MAG TPA: tetratricopeptide repeat protein, partial [Flavobacterium sp.]|nr:tetratricopeptide repeat protein [Flavobacterium sp.]